MTTYVFSHWLVNGAPVYGTFELSLTLSEDVVVEAVYRVLVTYVFSHWLINGVVAYNNPLSLEASQNQNIEAVYNYVEDEVILIPVSLNLFLSDYEVFAGEIISFFGKLSRNDGGTEFLGGNIIYVVRDGVEVVAEVVTDDSGNYQGSFYAPTLMGVYYVEAVFVGQLF